MGKLQRYLISKPCTSSGIQSFGLSLLETRQLGQCPSAKPNTQIQLHPSRRSRSAQQHHRTQDHAGIAAGGIKRGANSLLLQGNILIFPHSIPLHTCCLLLPITRIIILGKLQQTSKDKRTIRALQRDLTTSFFLLCPSSSNKIKKRKTKETTTK